MRPSLLLITLAAAVTLAGPAVAQIVDVAAGSKRAQVCFACHGENGVSPIPGTPHLAGQDRGYLESALKAYRGGSRQEPTMGAMAKPLSDADIANIAAYFHLSKSVPATESLSELLAVQGRIAPVGVVQVGRGAGAVATTATADAAPAAESPRASRSGQAIYESTCVACHASGAAGAPKFGDAAAWASRLAQGKDILLTHTISGFKAMPPRGTCMDCSDEEFAAVVDYVFENAAK